MAKPSKNVIQKMFPIPDTETIRRVCNPDNSSSKFSNFIGNKNAVRRLARIAAAAATRENRLIRDPDNEAASVNIALLGPTSTGKTTLAKLFADVLDLPLCIVHPKSIKNSLGLVRQITECLEGIEMQHVKTKQTVTMEPIPIMEGAPEDVPPILELPPMIVFIDEVHALSNNVVQALLQAVEPKDAWLHTEAAEFAPRGWRVNTWNVCWFIATTDRGKLFDAFDTRFQKIYLDPYGKNEIAQIVHMNYPNLNQDQCQQIAEYVHTTPREALSFTADLEMALKYAEKPFEVTLRDVASEHNIDEFGLSKHRLSILTALGQQGPIAKNRLTNIANCKIEELEKYILPPMLRDTEDSPALCNILTGRGVCITQAGLDELDKRNIKHLGKTAIPGSNSQLWN